MLYDFHPTIPGKSRYEFFVSVEQKVIGIFRTDDIASIKVLEGLARDYAILNVPGKRFEIELKDNNDIINERLKRAFRSGPIKNND